jgi:hypothetical protein
MDERIFNFNKIVIDTVYDIICFLYPVTGGPRDFARFYVLETVARVPYFAYLSVMHLRETFGERDPKLGERMRTHYAEVCVCHGVCVRASVSKREGKRAPFDAILGLLLMLVHTQHARTRARAHTHTRACSPLLSWCSHKHAYSLRLITSSTTC